METTQKKSYTKLIIVLALLLVIVMLWFNVSEIKSVLFAFKDRVDAHPQQAFFIYFLIYVVVTSFSLPLATILTFGSGYLFGTWWALLLVSLASSLGASFAMLIARYLVRNWVEQRYGQSLRPVLKEFAKNGKWHLLSMRLLPFVPFFLINLTMGLTHISTKDFFFITWLGILPLSLLYVLTGAQLSDIQNLPDLFSWPLLSSLIALAIVPQILIRTIGNKSNAMLKRFKKPRSFDRNLMVIGAGAGGLISAYTAAYTNAKVTLIERHKMGGECLNTGCVPSKAILALGKIAHSCELLPELGATYNRSALSHQAICGYIQKKMQTIAVNDSIERYQSLGVDVVLGNAKIIDPWTVEVEAPNGQKQLLQSKSLIIATGSTPVVPEIPGIDAIFAVTTDNFWDTLMQLPSFPQKILVIGGGYIGCELSQACQRLGAQIYLIERNEHLLMREDADVAEVIQETLTSEGVLLYNHSVVERFEKIEGRQFAHIKQKNASHSIEFDLLLLAIGRKPNSQGFGLEELELLTEEGRIKVNNYGQTDISHIYAVGDVATPNSFTHTAEQQAVASALHALFGGIYRHKLTVQPAVLYTDPTMARAGLNEKQAKAQNISYESVVFHFAELDRAILENKTKGFIKILLQPKNGQILGVSIVGEPAEALLPEWVTAINFKLKLSQLSKNIYAYPSWSMGNKMVASKWRSRHVPVKVLQFLQKFHAWRIR